ESATSVVPRHSQATRLVALALEAELFHTPDQEPFASMTVVDHRETWPLKSRGFRSWLARQFHQSTGASPSSQAIADALNALQGRALFNGPELPVFVRLGEDADGAIYLDLADATWRAVRIEPGNWRIVSDPPLRFRRSRGMLPLPDPVRGGT